MDKKIEELVEWVRVKIIEEYEPHDGWNIPLSEVAKQILSHPDLALIDRSVEYPVKSLLMLGYIPAVPLAEALKEK